MKKGQLMGQPFLYIFFLVVAAAVLFFGIRALLGVWTVSKDVEYKRFVNDIEKVENKVYTDSFGSTLSLEKIKVPSFISEVCFIDRDSDIELNLVKDRELRNFINISYNNVQKENVFFASDELKSIILERVFVDGENSVNPLCDDTRDRKIDIRFVNQGNFVRAELVD